ncbi:ABC transporter permease [Acidiferrimicrobium sp. IK]|uniref:ABC transporter permease n=1 Tax=Acidiferrimicrobium sp. IK TaxID=2871700 RepID=UPI0021CB2D3A|nr:ABC transporter permease [Acidiferrimicrobium sp. IK]MCU4185316.1 ABC transporter permease [Acidiferrimicrobium sp. IK]
MNPHLFRLELRRFVRNRRTLLFTAILPAVFFLTFSASSSGSIAGLNVAPYIMVSMATYGAMNALFVGGGVIAAERAIGWPRQLRVAGLSPREYVTSKVAVAYLTGIPGLLAVFVLGAAAKHVQLSAAHWLLAAVSILVGLLPVAVLGVAVGYAARPQTLQALFGIGSALLALLGGMFAPADNFPRVLLDVCKLLPTYWSADAGRAVLRGSWVGWHGALVLALWTVALGAAAAALYQRDALRPGVSGTT